MRRTLVGVIAALLLVTAACGGGGGEGSSPDTSSELSTDAPEAESTQGTEEAEQGGNEAVAVELPGLPVGGSSNVVSPTLQCVDVSWSGPPDLPQGWGITITGVGFDPPGDFALSGEPCPDDTPSCTASGFQLTSGGGCHVAVTWTRPNTDGGSMGFTRGVVTCPPGRVDACKGFLGEVDSEGPQTIDLEPSPAPEESESSQEPNPDESSSPAPDEAPSEAPSEDGGETGSTDGGG
jgi:hypothetical protein